MQKINEPMPKMEIKIYLTVKRKDGANVGYFIKMNNGGAQKKQ